ncbi:MAG TPA: hypothetical protein VGL08_06710 [Paraburkholderia sp.]|jgi:hypothetical protein
MLLLFMVLGGAITDLPKDILDLLQLSSAIKEAGRPPGPLVAALILTSLLPSAPFLQSLDETIKAWFQRVGNIPFEVRELSEQLKHSEFVPSGDALGKLQPALQQAGIDEKWLDAATGTLTLHWARTAALYLTMKIGSKPRGFLRFADRQKNAWAEIESRFDALRNVLDDGLLVQMDEIKDSMVARQLAKKLRKDMDDLHEKLCDFVSGSVLETERSLGQRNATLTSLGFTNLHTSRHTLGSHEIVLVVGMIFLAMMFIGLVSRRFVAPTPLDVQFRIAVVVVIVYGIAIIVGIYPKAVWSFADIRRVGRRPVAGYAVSGFVAAFTTFFVLLLFRFVFDQPGNLLQTISTPGAFGDAFQASVDRWPWLLMSFSATVTIAWTADNHASTPDKIPLWLRPAEAVGTSAVCVLAQWLTFDLLVDSVPNLAQQLSAPKLLGTAALIGGIVGALVPHLYRKARLRSVERMPGIANAHPAV